MILDYNDCITKYGNENKLKEALKEKRIYKIEKGIYSENERIPEIEIIAYKNRNAVFASDSAYFYHDVTDYVPDKYYLATTKDAYKIRDKRVKQIFYLDKQFQFGIEEKEYNGTKIRIYDKERMLIELIRKKSKMPFDYYKEIIRNYRDISEALDIKKIQNYLKKYKNGKTIYERIMLEVF